MSSIKKLYFNPRLSGSYSGLSNFYNSRHLDMSKEEVEKELLKLKEYYLYRPSIRKFKKRRVMVYFPNWILTFDLISLLQYKKENRGFGYVLLLIDCYTKKIYVEAMKSKDSESTLAAFKKIFKRLPVLPKYVFSDLGSEFINKRVQEYFKSQNVIWYSTHSKSSIAERGISTIMQKLIRLFAHKNSNHYLKDLQSIVTSYNNTRHRSTGFSPNSINEENQFLVFRNLYKELLNKDEQEKKPKFSVGMLVRWSLVKPAFEKGYFPRWSLEVGTIAEIKPTDPFTYTIRDSSGEILRGSFYEQELLPVGENGNGSV